MSNDVRPWAVLLLALASFAEAVPLPAPVRVGLAGAGLIAAPGLLIVRFLPPLPTLDRVVAAALFGVATVVLVSSGLAVADLWSPWAVLAIVWVVVAVLAYIPTQAIRARLRHPGDGTGYDPVRLARGDHADELDEVDVRVLWRDGRLCCRLTVAPIDRRVLALDLGRMPAGTPCDTSADRLEEGSINSRATGLRLREQAVSRRGRLTIDQERTPRLCEDGAGVAYLWFDSGTADDADDYRSCFHGTVKGWFTGIVDDREVALGINADDEPFVIAWGAPASDDIEDTDDTESPATDDEPASDAATDGPTGDDEPAASDDTESPANPEGEDEEDETGEAKVDKPTTVGEGR